MIIEQPVRSLSQRHAAQRSVAVVRHAADEWRTANVHDRESISARKADRLALLRTHDAGNAVDRGTDESSMGCSPADVEEFNLRAVSANYVLELAQRCVAVWCVFRLEGADSLLLTEIENLQRAGSRYCAFCKRGGRKRNGGQIVRQGYFTGFRCIVEILDIEHILLAPCKK